MDLQPNKTDGIYLPITNTRISASEWNQLVGSCMAFITEAGLTPDASDNEQFLNAFKTIAAGLGSIGANTNLSNLTATGEARFTTKANTDLGNVSATGKAAAIGWGMPDWSASVGLSTTVGTTNTITEKGWINCGLGAYNSTQGIVSVNGVNIKVAQSNNAQYSTFGTIFIPVDNGDTVKITSHSTQSGTAVLYFYPCKGAN